MLATALLLRNVESLPSSSAVVYWVVGRRAKLLEKRSDLPWALMMMARLGRETVSTVRRRGPERARLYPYVQDDWRCVVAVLACATGNNADR